MEMELTGELTPVDFTEMSDNEVDLVRQAAVAEIAARGEMLLFVKQAESLITSAFNRGLNQQEVGNALTEMTDKVYGPHE